MDNKEKYKPLLDMISQLAEKDAEFKKALMAVIPGSKTSDSTGMPAIEMKRLEEIEKYLGLDYSVDSQKSTIDYSYVIEQDYMAQLVSDNREMMRYRYGTRSHKIDFDEYCKYAQFQAEMLINMYYEKTDEGDLQKIKKHIIQNYPSAMIDEAKSISSISYAAKLISFYQEHCKKGNYDKTTFNNIREVRNSVSHRMAEKETFNIHEYQTELKKIGFSLSSDGYISTKALTDNIDLNNILETEIKKSEKYHTYLFVLWYNKQPYDEINMALSRLSSIIKQSCYNNTEQHE